MTWHFKILYVPKQTLIYDSSVVNPDGWDTGPIANEMGKNYLKLKKYDANYHLISVFRNFDKQELNPTIRQLELIEQIERDYSFIDIIKDYKGGYTRTHKRGTVIQQTTSIDADFLKKWFPHFNVGWSHQMIYNVFFNKPDNWAELRLPDI